MPGSGTLFVNHQVGKANQISAVGGVNVLRFVRDDGTVEKVGRAFSRIDGNIEGGLFQGSAWGSDARTGDVAALGRGALQPMPCPGARQRPGHSNRQGRHRFRFHRLPLLRRER